ncbi:MAG: HAMP domain-containing protein [Clostridia bacterium]|nr:HAMP domain-containing protein [Clostridia bacterium]
MKKSINIKFFMAVSCIIIFVILFVLLLNCTILEKYYLMQKRSSLIDIYNDINKNSHSLSNISSNLDKIDSLRNYEIVIRDNLDHTMYSTSRDFMKNNIFINAPRKNLIINHKNLSTFFEENQNYAVITFSDSKIGSTFIGLIGKLDNNYFIYIRTPLESIRESISISNSFLILVGTVSLLISCIVTLIVSKAFTKPIKELNIIAEKMSNLDFSQKYTVTTQDEIGTLGNSINKLSENLEKTIQDLKEANIDLEKDIEEKSKLNEMRSQFISDVSHELKTPIALIQGYAEGLSDGIAATLDDQKYYCNIILDEANRMSELTRDLLDLSKLEYGSNEITIETFNISELIKNTLNKMEVIFKENDIAIEFENENDIFVQGDVFRIEQVLDNYLKNAIKHVNENKLIKIKIEETDNSVKVLVFNSGEHISDENLQRIWTRFYKTDSSRNRENGGTGLGLSLVKAIMNQHHTNFGVQNAEGGVEFYFELNKQI